MRWDGYKLILSNKQSGDLLGSTKMVLVSLNEIRLKEGNIPIRVEPRY